MTSPFFDRAPIAENELAFAIEDAFPVTPGHSLVIPKREIATWWDATQAERDAIMRLVERVKAQLDTRDPRPDGYNVGFNAGAAAGQTVMHLHVHVIPRYLGDVPDPRGGVRHVIAPKANYLANIPADAEGPASADGPTNGSPGPEHAFAGLPPFVPGQEHHFFGAVVTGLRVCATADILSAFVQPSGLQPLIPHIEDALRRGARVRMLCGDYLGITSADALRRLLRLARDNELAGARLYLTPNAGSFHPKAWIFESEGCVAAYVGSSNISQTALHGGVEWNLLTSSAGDGSAARIQSRFDQLWHAASPLTPAVIAAYQQRAPVPQPPRPEPRPEPKTPHAIQEAALIALGRSRDSGESRGLVVMATGLGKTWLSAFDFDAMYGADGGARLLFVAHREEILTQAADTFELLLPARNTGLYTGKTKQGDADLLFATVQTLAQPGALERFPPAHFDYIVVDEFHHASAVTYRSLLNHFEPRFMLGITATPDRTDGASLLDLCNDNLVFEAGIGRGIGLKLLCPFKYYGLTDDTDYTPAWRGGRWNEAELTKLTATKDHAAKVLRNYTMRSPAQRRTLAFCCSTAHADFMAQFLVERGIEARSIHSKPSSAPRAATLDAFRAGDVEVICCVDVFNEGLDVPDINVVLMLRPTASPVVFLQQLGRGLRVGKTGDKPHLTVIDFIGNHRSFLTKPQALAALTAEHMSIPGLLAALRQGTLPLPEGCTVDIELEALDMLEQVCHRSADDTLVYHYTLLRDALGRRPTVGEVYAAGVREKTIKDACRQHGSWFDFVASLGDLDDTERQVVGRHREWFLDLLTTQMSASYKMIAVRALIDLGALTSEVSVTQLTQTCWRILQADGVLRRELASPRDKGGDFEGFAQSWRSMPLGIWSKGQGTSKPWFALDGETFRARLDVSTDDRDRVVAMTEMLVEARLQMHRSGDQVRKRFGLDKINLPGLRAQRLVVSHSSGKPILRFERDDTVELPRGDTEVTVDGTVRSFRFVKIAVNKVMSAPAADDNILPALMRGWFGPTAGLPGTRHAVWLCERAGTWSLQRQRPVVVAPTSIASPASAAWPASVAAPVSSDVTPSAPPITVLDNVVPLFANLRIACDPSPRDDDANEQTTEVRVATRRRLDASRHFVVVADGNSMDGGALPIRSGDAVLIERVAAGRPEEFEGRVCLVHDPRGANETYAMLKVPILTPTGWVMRSTAAGFEDLPLGEDSAAVVRGVALERANVAVP